VPHRSKASLSLHLYLPNGRRIELVDSETLCRFLGVGKPSTLINMAKRGDLPAPVHLNMGRKGARGRNQVRWNLPDVVRHLGLADK